MPTWPSGQWRGPARRTRMRGGDHDTLAVEQHAHQVSPAVIGTVPVVPGPFRSVVPVQAFLRGGR
ncbi:hypothetical protein [Streptomyces cinereoruber]|uniref:hypothetical protein n=1 Tax=Streptomyces cinereoruber TaxID=67260 RepID=UPI00362509B5